MKRKTLIPFALTLAVVAAIFLMPLWQLQAATPVSGALSAKAGSGGVTIKTFVKLSAAGTIVTATATSDKVVGVCEMTASANGLTKYAPACTQAVVTSGEQIVVGDLLTAGTGGKAFVLDPDTGASQRMAGIAMTATSGADEDVTILVQTGAAGAALVFGGDITIADGKNFTVGSATAGPPAGYVELFSATAAKGSLRLKQPDDANNKITTVQAANAAANATITLPNATGTVATLALAETLSSKTLTLPQVNDTSADHQYVFAVSELAADRTVTLPLLAGNDTFVFAGFEQTLTNKTLTAPAITGGTAIELTGLSVRSTGAAFDVLLASSDAALGADRTITLNPGAGNRTVAIGGDVSFGAAVTTVGAFSVSGAFSTVGDDAVILRTGAATDVTMPTTGTLATLGGAETVTGDKTFTGVVDISAATVTYRDIVNADVAAGAAIVRSKFAEEALVK